LDFDCFPTQATPVDPAQAVPSPPSETPGQHDSDARPNKRAQSSEGEGVEAIMPVWEAHEARLKLLQAACDVRSGMGEVCRNGSCHWPNGHLINPWISMIIDVYLPVGQYSMPPAMSLADCHCLIFRVRWDARFNRWCITYCTSMASMINA
jgi:hypothetical protein